MNLFGKKKEEIEAQEITELKEKIRSLQDKLAAAQDQADFLDRQNSGYKNEKEFVLKRLQESQARQSELETHISELEAQLAEPKEESTEETGTDIDLQEEINRLKAENDSLKSVNSDPNGEYQKLKNERDVLANAVSFLKSKLAEARQMGTASDNIKSLEEERDSYAEALDNCNVLLNTVKKAKSELQDKNKQLQAELAEAYNKITELEESINELKIKYSGNDKLQNELIAVKNELEAVKQENKKLEAFKTMLSQVKNLADI